MPKRPSREKPNERKGSADLTDPPPKNKKKRKQEIYIIVEQEEQEPPPTDPPVEELFQELIIGELSQKKEKDIQEPEPIIQKKIQPAISLTKKELTYFKKLPQEQQEVLNSYMESLNSFTDNSDIPLKFRILSLPVSDYIKSSVLKKVQMLEDDTGEHHKVKNWVDAFLKIPFGKTIPLPVCLDSGKEKCSEFLQGSRKILDDAVYGMHNAKTQIMQVISQWIANPESVGNVIALQGPAGVGKTSIARNGIAKALCRPFEFFSLGGASDVATYTGHSYTYEGSMWGRISDSLMHSKCMNPVLYFDELDKISGTPHGEEIASMLIHLTDRSQNTQFHDRYFSGIDLDVSQCLFVFSFNDISLVNPILRDRMQVIHCGGYSQKEKQTILEEYVWPDLLRRLKFDTKDIILNGESSKFLISEYSSKEEGVRTLIRTAEMLVTRLNMLRIANEETMKDYKFYLKVDFPLELNITKIRKLLFDLAQKEPELWRAMYN
jgi:ATP-dependent Lon protease